MGDVVRCVARVYPRESYGSFRGHQCSKPGVLEHDGKMYCKTHHPPSAKAREDARPKCALCSTAVNGTKYCSIHADVRVGRDSWEAKAARIAELEAEVAELRKDRARLDWLGKHGHCCDQFGSGSDDRWWNVVYNDGKQAEGCDPRAAIDAAMESA